MQFPQLSGMLLPLRDRSGEQPPHEDKESILPLKPRDVAEGGAMLLSIDRLLETTEPEGAWADDLDSLQGTPKRIARMDYRHSPTNAFDGEPRDEHFEVYYMPEEEAFICGEAGDDRKFVTGILRTRKICQLWARRLSMSWDRPEITGNPSTDQEIIREWRQEGSHLSMRIAAHMLMPKIRKVHAIADKRALRVQRKAFATLGRVPRWALTPERVEQKARDMGWPDPEYAPKDFLRLRWFRLALGSYRKREHEQVQEQMRENGRVRKALAKMPRGISGSVMQSAVPLLHVTPEPPERRLTWIALAVATDEDSRVAELAKALQRASTYKVRKAFRRAREIQAQQSDRLSEEDLYAHSEAVACRMIRWIADVNYAENDDLHCTGRTDVVNWAERSGRYHREVAQRRRERSSQKILRTNPYQTGVRPESLPEGLEALVRPQEVREEGRRMDHCVGGRAHEVAKGKTIILHYETSGHHATIEVKKAHGGRWKIGQARGPDNVRNRAVEEGRRKVKKWLEQSPTVRPPRLDLGSERAPHNSLPARRQLISQLRSGSGPDAEEKASSGNSTSSPPTEWREEIEREHPGETIEEVPETFDPQEGEGNPLPF